MDNENKEKGIRIRGIIVVVIIILILIVTLIFAFNAEKSDVYSINKTYNKICKPDKNCKEYISQLRNMPTWRYSLIISLILTLILTFFLLLLPQFYKLNFFSLFSFILIIFIVSWSCIYKAFNHWQWHYM